MGSLVQTKTITKLCNPILHFSDWKSMPDSVLVGLKFRGKVGGMDSMSAQNLEGSGTKLNLVYL